METFGLANAGGGLFGWDFEFFRVEGDWGFEFEGLGFRVAI